MSTTATASSDATSDASVGQADMKLEVVTIPVSAPPGSQCSIHLGKSAPGPAQGIFLIVPT